MPGRGGRRGRSATIDYPSGRLGRGRAALEVIEAHLERLAERGELPAELAHLCVVRTEAGPHLVAQVVEGLAQRRLIGLERAHLLQHPVGRTAELTHSDRHLLARRAHLLYHSERPGGSSGESGGALPG